MLCIFSGRAAWGFWCVMPHQAHRPVERSRGGSGGWSASSLAVASVGCPGHPWSGGWSGGRTVVASAQEPGGLGSPPGEAGRPSCYEPGLRRPVRNNPDLRETFHGFFTGSQALPHVIFSLVFPIASARGLGSGTDPIMKGPVCLCVYMLSICICAFMHTCVCMCVCLWV